MLQRATTTISQSPCLSSRLQPYLAASAATTTYTSSHYSSDPAASHCQSARSLPVRVAVELVPPLLLAAALFGVLRIAEKDRLRDTQDKMVVRDA